MRLASCACALVVACTGGYVAMVYRAWDHVQDRVEAPCETAASVLRAKLHPGYPSIHETRHFILAREVSRPSVAQLGDIAEQAFDVTARLLQLPQECSSAAVPIYLCTTADGLRALERAYGLSVANSRRRAAVGAFYKAVPMIAVLESQRDPEIVAHEVGHWAITFLGDKCPRVIDEGIAEYVADVVLAGRDECTEIRTRAQQRRRTALGRMNVEMPLVALFVLSYWEYQDSPYAVAASWCLVKVLVKLEEEERGVLASLLRAYDESDRRDVWVVFEKHYDVDEVERLWRHEVVETLSK